MKVTLIFLFTMLAAAQQKDTLPAIPVQKQLEIRTLQVQILRLSDALTKLTMQYQTMERQRKEAETAMVKLISDLPKPKDCPECELSDSLIWEKPKKEVAVQK